MRINKSILYFFAGAATVVITGIFFSFKDIDTKDITADTHNEGRPLYKWYAPELPKTISFAGERVPLERQEIREQLDRELLVNFYSHSSTLYILKLTTRYFPLIEQRLRANGLPEDFKYLCVAESSLQNQTSRVGAVGFWQFMKDTGPRYGLIINDEVDQRYDVLKATDAACQYLKEAYGKFGNWTGAAASYNCGMGGYTNYSTYQQTNDYYSLMLPDETQRYVFRIVALKYLISEAEKMGYMLLPSDRYKPYNTRILTVSTTIPDLAQFAINNGTTYRVLKTLNPWMRAHNLTVKPGASFDVLMPAN